MIVLDTSAIMAILLQEAVGHACIDALATEPDVVISAGTLAEAHIVAQGRNQLTRLETLLDILHPDVIPLDAERARRAANAHAQWGRGNHAAKLNFRDCFAYELAIACDCPLLFVGDDFRKTDVRCAIGGPALHR